MVWFVHEVQVSCIVPAFQNIERVKPGWKSGWEALFKAETLVMQEAVIAPLFTKANANLITEGVEGIDFHPVALNRVYKSAVIK